MAPSVRPEADPLAELTELANGPKPRARGGAQATTGDDPLAELTKLAAGPTPVVTSGPLTNVGPAADQNTREAIARQATGSSGLAGAITADQQLMRQPLVARAVQHEAQMRRAPGTLETVANLATGNAIAPILPRAADAATEHDLEAYGAGGGDLTGHASLLAAAGTLGDVGGNLGLMAAMGGGAPNAAAVNPATGVAEGALPTVGERAAARMAPAIGKRAAGYVTSAAEGAGINAGLGAASGLAEGDEQGQHRLREAATRALDPRNLAMGAALGGVMHGVHDAGNVLGELAELAGEKSSAPKMDTSPVDPSAPLEPLIGKGQAMDPVERAPLPDETPTLKSSVEKIDQQRQQEARYNQPLKWLHSPDDVERDREAYGAPRRAPDGDIVPIRMGPADLPWVVTPEEAERMPGEPPRPARGLPLIDPDGAQPSEPATRSDEPGAPTGEVPNVPEAAAPAADDADYNENVISGAEAAIARAKTPRAGKQFDSVARPGGGRRPLPSVTTEALLDDYHQQSERLQDAQRRSQYHTVESDIPLVMRTVATRNGPGPSAQAKAMQNLRAHEGVLDKLEAELKRRGVDDIGQAVIQRNAERAELERQRGKQAAIDATTPDEDGFAMPYERGPSYGADRVGERDLFGNESGREEQGSLLGDKDGTAAARNLAETERAARAELPTLRTRMERTTDPRERQQLAARVAELEKLVNRGEKITDDELGARAIAQSAPATPPAPATDAQGQGALFERGRRDSRDTAQRDLFAQHDAELAHGSSEQAERAADKLAHMAPKYATLEGDRRALSPDERIGNLRTARARRAWVDIRGAKIDAPADVHQLLAPFRDPEMEKMHVILMDHENRVLSHAMHTSGALNWAGLPESYADDIVDRAKRLGATRAIVAHNHPSGNPTPSAADYHATAQLGHALEQHGIDLQGHYVIDHTTGSWIRLTKTADERAANAHEYHESLKAPDALLTYRFQLARARHTLGLTADRVFGNTVPERGSDWTQGHGRTIRQASDVHALLDDARQPNAVHVLYLDTQNRAVALEPVRPETAATLDRWLPARAKALGARRAILAYDSELGGQSPTLPDGYELLTSRPEVRAAARLARDGGTHGDLVADIVDLARPGSSLVTSGHFTEGAEREHTEQEIRGRTRRVFEEGPRVGEREPGEQRDDERRDDREGVAGHVPAGREAERLEQGGRREDPGHEAGRVQPRERVAPAAPERSLRSLDRSGPGRFYSPLEEAIKSAPFEKGTADQWRAALSKGVTKNEREAVGIDAFLASHPGKTINRADVLAHAEQHAVRIGETTLGGGASADSPGLARLRALHDEASAQVDRAHAELANDLEALLPAHAKQDAQRITRRIVGDIQTQYEDGAEPDTSQILEDRNISPATVGEDEYRQLVYSVGIAAQHQQRLVGLAQSIEDAKGSDGDAKFSQYTEPGGENYREILLRHGTPGAQDFQSGHFDEPNILAHVRVKDRTLPNGEKVLFAEEMQSDWHQQGRERGYRDDAKFAAARRAHTEALPGALGAFAAHDNFGFDSTQHALDFFASHPGSLDRFDMSEVTDAQRAALERYTRTAFELRDAWKEHTAGVPDAPYKKTDEWTTLVLKRLIDEAAAGGYDRVAWTTGEQQAARYDLSKHVDRLEYKPERSLFNAYKGGELVHSGTYDEKALPSVVGKEAAQKLLQAERNEHGTQTLEGDGLKVGGQGMRSFYDEMLPRVARDYAKKLGVKIDIEHAPATDAPEPAENARLSHDDDELARFEPDAGKVRNPSFKITPELRERVMKGGQPVAERRAPYNTSAGDRTGALNVGAIAQGVGRAAKGAKDVAVSTLSDPYVGVTPEIHDALMEAGAATHHGQFVARQGVAWVEQGLSAGERTKFWAQLEKDNVLEAAKKARGPAERALAAANVARAVKRLGPNDVHTAPWFQQALARYQQHIEQPGVQAARQGGVKTLRNPKSAYLPLIPADPPTGPGTAMIGVRRRNTRISPRAEEAKGIAPHGYLDGPDALEHAMPERYRTAALNRRLAAVANVGTPYTLGQVVPDGQRVVAFDDKAQMVNNSQQAGQLQRYLVPAKDADALVELDKRMKNAVPTTLAGKAARAAGSALTGLTLESSPVSAPMHANALSSAVKSTPKGPRPTLGDVPVPLGGRGEAIVDMQRAKQRLASGDQPTRALLTRLSEAGALHPMPEPDAASITGKLLRAMKLPESVAAKLDVPTRMHEWLFGAHGVDQRARIVLAERYLAQHPQATNEQLRAFVTSKAGNYVANNAGSLIHELQRSGVAPFAPFHTARLGTAAKSAVGVSGLGNGPANVGRTVARGLVGAAAGAAAAGAALSGRAPDKDHLTNIRTPRYAMPDGSTEYGYGARGDSLEQAGGRNTTIRGTLLEPHAATAERLARPLVEGHADAAGIEAMNEAAAFAHPAIHGAVAAATGHDLRFNRKGEAQQAAPRMLTATDQARANVGAGGRAMSSALQSVSSGGTEPGYNPLTQAVGAPRDLTAATYKDWLEGVRMTVTRARSSEDAKGVIADAQQYARSRGFDLGADEGQLWRAFAMSRAAAAMQRGRSEKFHGQHHPDQ